MLGRQWCHVSEADLERELRHADPALKDIRAVAKRARETRFMEPVLELLGALTVDSLDFSDYEQATIVHDINERVADALKERFSCVFDGGTLEHVFDFPRAIRNAMEMVAVGGHFLGVGPVNNLPGHGFYQFSPELYFRIFSEQNGFVLEEVSVCEARRNAPFYRIDDPMKIGRRVQFTNSKPAYVMVRARRLRRAAIFKTVPQQTYYETAWSGQQNAGNLRSGRESLRDWAKRSLPEPVKKIIRPWVPQVRQLHNSGFEKI
jgi:SAM-dependent methyltransferase